MLISYEQTLSLQANKFQHCSLSSVPDQETKYLPFYSSLPTRTLLSCIEIPMLESHLILLSAVERDRIVELIGDVPRIELFARQTTPGWDVWGNEIQSDIEMKSEEEIE